MKNHSFLILYANLEVIKYTDNYEMFIHNLHELLEINKKQRRFTDGSVSFSHEESLSLDFYVSEHMSLIRVDAPVLHGNGEAIVLTQCRIVLETLSTRDGHTF